MTGLWLPSYLTWFSVGIVHGGVLRRTSIGTADDAVVGSTRVASTLRQMGLAPGVCWTAALRAVRHRRDSGRRTVLAHRPDAWARR